MLRFLLVDLCLFLKSLVLLINLLLDFINVRYNTALFVDCATTIRFYNDFFYLTNLLDDFLIFYAKEVN